MIPFSCFKLKRNKVILVRDCDIYERNRFLYFALVAVTKRFVAVNMSTFNSLCIDETCVRDVFLRTRLIRTPG